MRRGHSRISHVSLPRQRGLGSRSLYFRFLGLSAVSLIRDSPRGLSRRFAKHVHHVVWRDFLRRMSEENAMFVAADDHASLGQSARWLFGWLSYCRHFLRRGFASRRLGKFQDPWFRRHRLLCCNIYQSSWLAHLRRRSSYARPLRAKLYHRVVVLLLEHDHAGKHSRHCIY